MKQQQQQGLSPVRPSKINVSSKKFLTHFQSINTPMKIPPPFLNNPATTDRNKYNAALQLYASSVSIIDKIADSPIKQSQINNLQGNLDDIVKKSIIANVNPRVRQRIVSINRFFQAGRGEVDQNGDQGRIQEGGLNGYIQSIINVDVSYAITRIDSNQQFRKRSHSKSKSKQSFKNLPPQKTSMPQINTEVKQKLHEAQVNTQPIATVEKSNNKLKKMDLLLVQIMRQKKRKGLVPDYFRAIQMKLVELLQYILQDQPGYFGLTLKQKMKDVLKNLQSFKGKTIDGESKVNMLRIFFEEFRNLKKQRQQESNEIQNRSKSNSKKSVSKAQSKKSASNPNKFPAKNYKKNFDTMSLDANRGQKAGQKKNPSQKSKEQDQWIGSLQK